MRLFCFLIIVLLSFYIGASAQEGGLKIGQVPPTLSYFSISENKIVAYKEEGFKGNIWLIDFWATWCAPCIESIPHLNKLVEEYNDKNVKFISITYESENLAKKFLADHPMKSDIGLDGDFKMFRSYNAWAIPNIVMINSKGKFAGRIHPTRLNGEVIDVLLNGGVPDVENTPEDAFDPAGAEEYFRSFLDDQRK